MIIDRLLITNIYNDENNPIRDIKFHKGLNIITNTTSSKAGNNIGKKTVLKIIQLCLMNIPIDVLYYDNDLFDYKKVKDINDIKLYLNNTKVVATLFLKSLDNKKQITIKRQLYDNGTHLIIEENKNGDHVYHANVEKVEFASANMKRILFGYEQKYPKIEELMPKFIRLGYSANMMLKFLIQDDNSSYRTIYQFLFGLVNRDIISNRSILKEKKNNYDKIIKTFKQDETFALQEENAKKELKEIDSKINDLIHQRDMFLFPSKYKKEIEENEKREHEIYLLKDKISTIDFQLELINENIQYFSEIEHIKKKKFFEKQFEIQQKHKKELEEELEKILPNNEQIFDYHEFDEKIKELQDRKEKLIKYTGIENIIDEMNKDVDEKIKDINIQIQKELENSKEKINEFNNIFRKYAKKLFPNNNYYLSDYLNEEKEFPFTLIDSRNPGSVGDAYKKALIAVFDLAFTEYTIKNNIECPKFSFLNKCGDISPRYLHKIFEICNEKDFEGQLIITSIRDKLETTQKYFNFEEKDENGEFKYIVLELSEEEKFFKMP